MTNLGAILLVEDNDDDADLTVKAFVRARVENPIVRARDGIEGLDYLMGRGDFADRHANAMPAVVLLDLNMPRLDGIEVLKAVRANDVTRRLPIVILTSSNDERDRLVAYDNYANSYVRKPVDYGQFVEAARQLGLYWLILNSPPPPPT